MLALILNKDSKVALLQSINIMDDFDQVMLQRDLSDKIYYQSLAEGWTNHVAIYSSLIDNWIGRPALGLSKEPKTMHESTWFLNKDSNVFIKYIDEKNYFVQVSFPLSNITEMLDHARKKGSDPVMFNERNGSVIYNRGSDRKKVNAIIHNLNKKNISYSGSETIEIGDTKYMVNYVKGEKLGWVVMDYIPLDRAFQPIIKTKLIYYIACFVVFILSVVFCLYLFRKVQTPLLELLKGVQFLKQGNFSARVKRESKNEFDYLFANFNEMAEQIEELIERVYKEQIISREALLKEMQAQINPHFLYNCLFFINNMIRLGNDEAATAMTQNLAEYYRYTTRLENPKTTLQDEINFVNKYLTIQCLRNDRLNYDIRIPDDIRNLSVPKLLVQPLVENSIIHGIGMKMGAKNIRISSNETNDSYVISVEDDGKGLTDEEMDDLRKKIAIPLDNSMGCALWNINQRLKIYYGEQSGLSFSKSRLGGLMITLTIKKSSGVDSHVSTISCG
jgi:two-component system sensor histidine kinase YesM